MRYESVVHRRPLARLLPAFLCASCAEWPLSAHLPEQTPGTSADVDPSTVFEVDWHPTPVDETFEATLWPVDTTTSWLFLDVLEGVGWSQSGQAPPIDGGPCGTLGYYAPPGVDGAYTSDIDVLTLEAANAGWLCVTADAASDIGWDVLVFELDDCGVPGNPVESEGRLPGLGREGRVSFVIPVLESRRYALMLAGFRDLSDPDGNSDLEVPYRVGVSLLAGATAPYACPNLPEETP